MRRQIAPASFLASLALFKGLPTSALDRLAAGASLRRLARGASLFRPGETPTGLHALVFGRIALRAIGPDGERVVDVITPGTTFGEPVLLLNRPYIVAAAALADSLVLHVARDTVIAEIDGNPAFRWRVITTLASRIEGLVTTLQDYALSSASRRFVAWLLRRRAVAAAHTAVVITLPGTKKSLASQLNLSAEHLSRVMHELAARGLIVIRAREVRIPDPDRLRAWQLSDASDS